MRGIRIHELPIDGPIEPFDAYRRLATSGPSVLLDGSPGRTSDIERRAYVLFDPVDVVRVDPASDRAPAPRDPIATLVERLTAYGHAEREPDGRFRGGGVGFLSYDVGRHLERVPDRAAVLSGVPDLWFGIFHRGLEIDLESGDATLFVAELDGSDRSGDRYVADALADAARRLAAPLPRLTEVPSAAGPLRSNFDRASYETAVEAVRESIRAGDVYQVNLSQRFETDYRGDVRALYARLRDINPAPYSCLVETGGPAILSTSPEMFVRKRGAHVETRPIKGTRPRTGDVDQDRLARDDLERSAKDAAELAMIVDLERNDLSRVCRVGSVVVDSPGHLEAFPTVYHRVAIVRGELAGGTGLDAVGALLRATFPGGSITGAPKIRAMAEIDRLEGARRGIFTGSVGWIGFDGELDLNIAIRTVVVEGGLAHFHVGGGVVLDSDPAGEYEETLAKGRALAEALGHRLT